MLLEVIHFDFQICLCNFHNNAYLVLKKGNNLNNTKIIFAESQKCLFNNHYKGLLENMFFQTYTVF